MRDTFLLLWTAFLIIGVVGSIVSSIRKQIQGARPPAQRPIPPQWQPSPPQTVTLSGARAASAVEGRRVVLQGTVPAGQAPQWLQQARAQIAAAQVSQPAPPPAAPKATQPPPKAVPKPSVILSGASPASGVEGQPHHLAPKAGVARLFRHRSAIVQAVIAAEVLGKPRAFSDEYFRA